MAKIRTFVAFEIDKSLRSAATEITEQLSRVVDGGRWVRPENLHVTLKFLGEVEDRELHSVCRAAQQAASEVATFSVNCRSVGAFPNTSRPATIWLGLDDPQGTLGDLHMRVETSMSQLGFPAELRPYRGHLTLGRIRGRADDLQPLTESLEKMSERDFGILQVRELVVFSSELERGSPEYTVLARCPLG